MTTIAYDGTSVSVDSLATSDGLVLDGPVTKYVKLVDGSVALGAGDWTMVQRIFAALKAGEEPAEEWYSEVDIITIDAKGRVTAQSGTVFRTKVTRFPIAWGSGRELAIGAMAAGADSRKATQIAARFSTTSGGPVRTFAAGMRKDWTKRGKLKEAKPTAAQRVYPEELERTEARRPFDPQGMPAGADAAFRRGLEDGLRGID